MIIKIQNIVELRIKNIINNARYVLPFSVGDSVRAGCYMLTLLTSIKTKSNEWFTAKLVLSRSGNDNHKPYNYMGLVTVGGPLAKIPATDRDSS